MSAADAAPPATEQQLRELRALVAAFVDAWERDDYRRGIPLIAQLRELVVENPS